MPIILDIPNNPQNFPTLAWVRTQVSRKVEQKGGFYQGSATGGTTTTLTDPGLSRWDNEPNHWLNAEVRFNTGLNAGLVRTVSASGSSGITFAAFPSTVQAGDEYELRQEYPTQSIDDAIAESVRDASANDMPWVEFSDSSLTWVDQQQSYSIPPQFDFLWSVEYEDDTGKHPIRFNHWDVVDGELRLDQTAQAKYSAPSTTAPNSNVITLRGYRKPVIPVADTDLVEVSTPYAIWYATAVLKGQEFGGPSTDPDNNAQAFSTFMQFGASRGPSARTYMKPNTRPCR